MMSTSIPGCLDRHCLNMLLVLLQLVLNDNAIVVYSYTNAALSQTNAYQSNQHHARVFQAVKALETPKMPMPANAPTIHSARLCVRSRLSLNSWRATLAIIPAVIANMPP